MHVVNTLAPLFLIIALGAVLRRWGFAPAEVFRQINRLVYWVGLPCLLFHKTARTPVHAGAAAWITLVLLGGMASCLALALLAGRVLRVPRRSLGALMQGAYRGNLAYVGLAVILFSVAGPDGRAPGEVESLAVLAIAPLVPVYNAVAVAVLLIGQEAGGRPARSPLRTLTFNVVTNPLLLACAAGIGYSLTGLPLPATLRRTVATIGEMALPLALLAIGASLTLEALRDGFVPAAAAAAIKLAGGPVAGYLLATLLGLGRTDTRIALIYLACPTAIVSFVMAEQLGADGKLAAGIVVITTVLSLPALAVVLLVT